MLQTAFVCRNNKSVKIATMVWPFFGYGEEAKEPSREDVIKPPEEAFECDYERDCTPLYRAIESATEPSEFEAIARFLDKGLWPGTFFTDSITPADQAKTWVTRFDNDDPNKIKWSQLPLHLAIVCNAPPSVIGRLVKLYPQALRCTDDQHMLPLHLALRHGADDEIVAYILLQFPEAVNAKGKNGRSAVDCALRAKDKLRGKILEIFVEKNKGRKSASFLKQQQHLEDELKAKTDELNEFKAEFDAMAVTFDALKGLKNNIEMDLLTKIQELEQSKAEQEAAAADKIERLQSEKMLEAHELQKQLEAAKAATAELTASEKQLLETEATLRMELDRIHARIAKSSSPDDWFALKAEVDGMQANLLERSRTETKTKISSLKGELQKTMQEIKQVASVADSVDTKNELQSELKSIQKTVGKLEQNEKGSKTTEELNVLRSEVDDLRAELKNRAEASKTRVELSLLKQTMESELKNSQGKTEDDIAALKKAIGTTNINQLENKTNAELATLKVELESLKKSMKNKELTALTKAELDEFWSHLESEIKTADPKRKTVLASMKTNAEKLRSELETTDSSDRIIAVKKSVEQMKNDLKKKEASIKIMTEVTALRSIIEAELKKSDGKTQEELLQVKKQIKSLNEKDLAMKDVDELTNIKNEVAVVKKHLKEVEKASQTKQELEVLKKSLAAEMKNISLKAEKELELMKKVVDEVNMEQKESKNLKKNLAENIKQANKQTEQELLTLKKALDAIDVNKLESKNREGWEAIRADMEALKTELVAKQASKDSVAAELESIKKTVESFNLDMIEKKNDSEFKSLRKEMDAMRESLQRKEQGEVALKKEIEGLKSDSKRKKGLKKFLSRQFGSWTADEGGRSQKSVSMPSPTGSGAGSAHTFDPVTTIYPPSMAHRDYGVEAASSDDSSTASTAQVLRKLTVSFVDDVPEVETVHTEDEMTLAKKEESSQSSWTSQSKSQKPPLIPAKNKSAQLKNNIAFRKVQSMAPRIASPKKFAELNSSTSKESVGDVKSAKVNNTMEGDVLIPNPAQ